MEYLLLLLFIAIVILVVLRMQDQSSIRGLKNKLFDEQKDFEEYKEATEYLKKYEKIVDVEKACERLMDQGEWFIVEAGKESKEILSDARKRGKEIRERAEAKIQEAFEMAENIQKQATENAENIAGEAWEAKRNADQYESTVKAMKNIIKGYGDEYLIPSSSLLDDLAEEYDFTEAGQELKRIRNLVKTMIKNDEVADCSYAEPYRRRTAIQFVTDAFNGKVDSIMSKVKHDNYGVLEQKIEDAFRLVNHNGQAFRNAHIRDSYFSVILEQLKQTVIVQEIKKRDQEEQKRIREEIREEERARREYEKAIREAEKEERMLQRALKQARKELESAAQEEKEQYETKLQELMKELDIAHEKGQRAMSMAQQTKQGHVYIISNIGSFGEDIFKIGLTRRLIPTDRVRELGDASVPFSFDIHAMIHSENAPQLERDLHEIFKDHQVNKVNPRKEFFNVPISDIKDKVEGFGLNTHWTMKAEAMEYRESIQLATQNSH